MYETIFGWQILGKSGSMRQYVWNYIYYRHIFILIHSWDIQSLVMAPGCKCEKRSDMSISLEVPGIYLKDSASFYQVKLIENKNFSPEFLPDVDTLGDWLLAWHDPLLTPLHKLQNCCPLHWYPSLFAALDLQVRMQMPSDVIRCQLDT